MGASTQRAASSGAASRTATPCGSVRADGCSSPAMLDRPIACGSANAQYTSRRVAGCHRAREPTWVTVETQTSTSAISRAGPAALATSTLSTLAR